MCARLLLPRGNIRGRRQLRDRARMPMCPEQHQISKRRLLEAVTMRELPVRRRKGRVRNPMQHQLQAKPTTRRER